MNYAVRFTNKAERNLKKIPEPYRERLFRFSAALGVNPYPRGLEKVVDRGKTYRVRLGDYRIVWFIEDEKNIVHIMNIDKRPRVYK